MSAEHIVFTADAGDLLRDKALTAVRRLQAAGFIAYWAGGCVRDLLLALVPKDYDIATSAVPEQVAALFPQAQLVGKSFGVVRAPVDEHYFEIATFREDRGYADGRHPDTIVYADPPADAQRRDFTINALFYDPVQALLYDYTGGRKDLQQRLVRAVGAPLERFREDHLRMLRAVRFAARLGFEVETATAEAIRADAALLARISAERIREELMRILLEAQRAGDALLLLDRLGLLAIILPEVSAMKGQAQPPEYHPEGDVFTHTVLMLNAMRQPTIRLALAILLHDIGKPPTARQVAGRLRFERHAETGAEMAQRLMERIRFANDDIDAVSFMIRNHMRFSSVQEMRRATLRTLVGGPYFDEELELHRLDCVASHRNLENYEFLRVFRDQLAAEKPLPPPWITGRDIMACGVPEGPEVGRWRQRAYELQLEGHWPDRHAALEWLHREIRQTP
jgi:poly(A) polymerase